MRLGMALLVAMVTGVTACAAAPTWPDRLDITLGPPATSEAGPAPLARGPRPATGGTVDLMVCVVDADGRGRCHHRDGVLTTTSGPRGSATCAGAGAPLRPACAGPGRPCVLAGVQVPAGPFGLLVLSVRPPAFGMPRHAVADAAILAREPGHPPAPARDRIAGALAAVARCLAPADTARPGAELPVVALGACTARACDLGRVSLRFPSRGSVSMAGH